jgi:hypothetical protein
MIRPLVAHRTCVLSIGLNDIRYVGVGRLALLSTLPVAQLHTVTPHSGSLLCVARYLQSPEKQHDTMVDDSHASSARACTHTAHSSDVDAVDRSKGAQGGLARHPTAGTAPATLSCEASRL